MQYASCIPVLLLALLAALTRGDESQPQPSSQSVSEHEQVRSPLAQTFDEDEEEKRAWRELSSSWGKRGWQDLQSPGWGKRGWQDLQSSGWGKRGWQDLQSAGWGKRGWQDLQSSGWGKRGWQDLQSSGWGKRGWKDMPSQGWGKRAWKDLNSSWGKRGWQDLQGSWGKRDSSSLDYTEDEDYSGEDKRAWENLRGTWGKRSGDWDNYRVSRGKRDPNWQSLKGLWGKRSLESMTDLNKHQESYMPKRKQPSLSSQERGSEKSNRNSHGYWSETNKPTLQNRRLKGPLGTEYDPDFEFDEPLIDKFRSSPEDWNNNLERRQKRNLNKMVPKCNNRSCEEENTLVPVRQKRRIMKNKELEEERTQKRSSDLTLRLEPPLDDVGDIGGRNYETELDERTVVSEKEWTKGMKELPEELNRDE